MSLILPAAAFVVIAMRLFGTDRWIVAALLYGGGWTCLIFAAAQHRRSRELLGLSKETLSVFLKANSRFIAAVMVLILLAYVAVVLFPADRGEFATATRDELTQKIEGDFAMLPVYLRGLDDAAAAIEKDKRLLEGDPSKLSPEDKTLLLQLWSRYLAYSLQLDQIKHVHKHFYQINYLQFPDLNLTSFLIAYSAFASSFSDALKLTALVGDNDYLKTLLNEAHDDYDVPRDAYLSLARAVTDPNNLIKLNDLLSAMKELEPGDILLERRNWYLTNVGIPGFWPHTALYTGTLKEMEDYFKGETLPGGVSMTAYVQATFPALFSNLVSCTREGFEFRVLEAVGSGVVPTAFENSGRADYLAVLRPKLNKADKLQSLMNAFNFYKRPYDYNFDFLTDNELVCSELIYKTYRPG